MSPRFYPLRHNIALQFQINHICGKNDFHLIIRTITTMLFDSRLIRLKGKIRQAPRENLI